MNRRLLKSKIHRATVTDSNLEYDGSITIDSDLLAAANIVEYELVQVVNLNNGARFETYVIAGEAGSGKIEVNGAAARLAQIGDKIIAMAYDMVNDDGIADWNPNIVLLDEKNLIKEH